MKRFLLGIDVGTTGTKTYLFSESGEIVSSAYRGYEMLTPDTQTSELVTDEIWQAVVETVRNATASIEKNEKIAAVSLSTQGGTLIPVDKKYNPVFNAIVWNDRNCTAEKDKFIEEFGNGGILYQLTGWQLGSGLPLLQTRRLKDRYPDVFSKTDLFLSVHDFISAKMTGKPVVDMSNAGINQFVDIKKEKYDERLLAFAGIHEDRLAVLSRSGKPVGRLTGLAAEELGLSCDTVFVAGAHDQYAAAVGAGACKCGDTIIGTGTSWVVTSLNSENDFSSGLAQSVSACDSMWGSLASLSYGGACVEWMRKKVVSTESGHIRSLKDIDTACSVLKAAEDGLFFYPFMCFLSDDRKKRSDRAQFIGLDVSHNASHMILAVMEGIAFQLKWLLESFPFRQNRIKLTGGASKSEFWTQIIADVLDCPVVIADVPDIACVGAAVLAGIGSGVYGSMSEGCGKLLQSEKAVYPVPAKADMYRSAFLIYKRNADLISRMCLK